MRDRPMIDVMLVDDQTAARANFMMMLAVSDDIRVVAQASNGASALQMLRAGTTQLPDIILMGVRMPVLDGIAATGTITREFPQIKVLLITAHDQDEYALAGVEQGAVGFLLKDTTSEQLRSDIHTAYHHGAVFSPRVQRLLLDMHRHNSIRSVEIDGLRARFRLLTKREFAVARLVAEGMTNADIARTLILEVPSVRKTISRILPKLGVHDRTQIAVSWYKARMDEIMRMR